MDSSSFSDYFSMISFRLGIRIYGLDMVGNWLGFRVFRGRGKGRLGKVEEGF